MAEKLENKVAIEILEEILKDINTKRKKEDMLKCINSYIKAFNLITNDDLTRLLVRYGMYKKNIGPKDKRTQELDDKIDEEIKKVYE